MKFKHTAALAALLTTGIVACDGEDITGLVIADLAGTWTASSLTFTPTEQGSESNPIPFIALGGGLTVTIAETGTFTGTLTVPGAITGGAAADLPVGGTMSLSEDDDGEDIIDVDFNANTEAVFAQAGLPFEDFDGPIAFTSTRITITNETTFDFDLGGPGAEEPASLLLVLDRDDS